MSSKYRPALLRLEDLAANAEMDSFTGRDLKASNPKLNEFAVEVYKTLHWINSPSCRKNHSGWDPLRESETLNKESK